MNDLLTAFVRQLSAQEDAISSLILWNSVLTTALLGVVLAVFRKP